MAKIVVIGSLNMDLVGTTPRLPLAGETLIGRQFATQPGGKGANQAYAVAKLGGEVAMLGRVGADDYGRQMSADLQSVGCDISGLQADEVGSGVAVILVADSGQNSIVVIPGANHRYLPADLHADDKYLDGAQLVLLQLETQIGTVLAAAQAARRHGAQVILDPAPAPDSVPADLLGSVDVLTPNETEATQLVGRPAAHLTTDDARAVAGTLLGFGVNTVVLKLGAQGCLLAQREGMTLFPAPTVEVVDTTAAGDVFNAALAVARSEGASMADACRFAIHAGALSVTRFGARGGVPTRRELDEFVRSNHR